jgi:hypothetical protein
MSWVTFVLLECLALVVILFIYRDKRHTIKKIGLTITLVGINIPVVSEKSVAVAYAHNPWLHILSLMIILAGTTTLLIGHGMNKTSDGNR